MSLVFFMRIRHQPTTIAHTRASEGQPGISHSLDATMCAAVACALGEERDYIDATMCPAVPCALDEDGGVCGR